jgi:hypothetical protein
MIKEEEEEEEDLNTNSCDHNWQKYGHRQHADNTINPWYTVWVLNAPRLEAWSFLQQISVV